MVGEHIRVRKGGRWYHAIDCGDETVLHLADEPGELPVRVRRSYRPEFVAGAEVVEVVTHRERTFPPNEVIARAFSRIADPVLASMFRDSEAFAKWCATGRIPPGPETAADERPAAGAPEGGKAAARKAGPTRKGKAGKGAGKASRKGTPPRARKAARAPARAKGPKKVKPKGRKGAAKARAAGRKGRGGARTVRRKR